MFFVLFWTALVRYTWLSNSSRFFSDNQYFRMFLVSMADIIGSYERSWRCENNIVQTVAAAQGFLSQSDGNRREQWLTSLTVWTVHSHSIYDTVRAVAVAKRRECLQIKSCNKTAAARPNKGVALILALESLNWVSQQTTNGVVSVCGAWRCVLIADFNQLHKRQPKYVSSRYSWHVQN